MSEVHLGDEELDGYPRAVAVGVLDERKDAIAVFVRFRLRRQLVAPLLEEVVATRSGSEAVRGDAVLHVDKGEEKIPVDARQLGVAHTVGNVFDLPMRP